jgi:decaprenylphospho-beta-D-ribofuranose 2-oxidase
MKKLKISSWGNYPIVDCDITLLDKRVKESLDALNHKQFIPFGNGRSYGDSAIGSNILYCKTLNYFLNFDQKNGILHVQSGVLLSDILNIIVPKGWFLYVTPGTKLITIGGAIASDVHGKNHHFEGCFSESIKELTIMLPNGDVVTSIKGDELFKATCGGMGLTGIILDAKIYLKKINSKNINQVTIKTKNLKDTFEVFENNKDKTYSVAWIDCLAQNDSIGRCILMTGEFADDGDLNYKEKRKFNIPFYFPSWVLNYFSVKIFNFIYYNKNIYNIAEKKTNIDDFFYPLDAIDNWNRIYGKSGFTQYQFILPKDVSYDGLYEILMTISKSGKGSFLAVLKLYGEANDNFLSFPLKGYSLALDFKIEKDIFELLNILDEIVVRYGGRIYLSKDCRVKKEIFEKGYPFIEKFRQYRKANNMNLKLESLQSKRVEI